MAQRGQRKCLCCGTFFDPDARNRKRQRYCSEVPCRRASKAASQAAWLAQPQNRKYFSDPLHVARMQAWRAAHPGNRARQPRKGSDGPRLQDAFNTQVPESIEESGIGYKRTAAIPAALQDDLEAASPLLTGLIAHLFESTLQEDIAATTWRLVQLGRDVINGSCRHEDHQTRAVARAAAPGTPAVQLG